jgi:prephenate dehydrogenase
MKKKKGNKKIAVIGYGNFGKLLVTLLSKDLDVFAYSRKKIEDGSIKLLTEENCKEMDYIIFSASAIGFESSVKSFYKKISKKTVIMDVSSVKKFTEDILLKYFPENEIICTHPLFGPESIKRKLKKLKVVVSKTQSSQKSFSDIKKFLTKKGFDVLEMTCEEHDKQMATVQALSHFIGFALRDFDLEKHMKIKTLTFDMMFSLYENVLNDTDELFETIQNYNPYAKKIREDFMLKLKKIDKKLK